jgi:hypothetical protein
MSSQKVDQSSHKYNVYRLMKINASDSTVASTATGFCPESCNDASLTPSHDSVARTSNQTSDGKIYVTSTLTYQKDM